MLLHDMGRTVAGLVDVFAEVSSHSLSQATDNRGGFTGRVGTKRTTSGTILLIAMSLALAGCAGSNRLGLPGDSGAVSSPQQTGSAAACPSCGTPGCTA